MWAMIVKEFRQVRRDRRTLAMMIVLPLILLVVFGYAASFDVDDIPTAVLGAEAGGAAGRLPGLFDVVEVDPGGDRETARAMLRDDEVAVAFVTGPPAILVDGSDLFAARSALTAIQGIRLAARPEVLFNPGLETSPVLVPPIAGLILIFIGTMVTSLGVVRERQAGTLEQLAVTPLGAWDVFVGKIAPYFVVAAVDLTVILGVGTLLFDVPFRGSVLVLALGAVLFLFVTLGLGILISSVSENQGQAIQLSIMTLLPQVLLSGMIFPIASMAAGVRWISYVLPLTYFVQISRGVMIRGAPLESLWRPMVLLAVLGAAVFGLAVVRFRRDLSPAAEPEGPDRRVRAEAA